MNSKAVQLFRTVAPFDLVGEPNVRSLALAIRHHRVVMTVSLQRGQRINLLLDRLIEIVVSDLDSAEAVCRARNGDNTAMERRSRRSYQQIFQKLKQEEVSQMVDPKLQLKAVDRP